VTRPESLSHADLVAHALGEGSADDRARVERALATDVRLGDRLAAVRAHLARYDALPPAPPPPPVDRVLRAVATAGARRTLGRRVAAVAVAASLVVGAVLALQRERVEPRGGLVASSVEDDVFWEDGRARAFLDAGARLEAVEGRGARLAAGRAWFEVEPAGGAEPFRVATRFGDVTVRGTAFEVDVRGEELAVAVASGRVEARGRSIGPGERLAGGAVERAAAAPGGFARVPRLALETDGGRAADGVLLRFVLENPRHVPLRVPGLEGAPATLWLSVTAPDGSVADLPVAADDWLPAGGDALVLAPRERRVVPVRFLRPFTSPGTYRGTALLRPDGLPPVRSATVPIEVQ
jgi:ferric-dicitrate binding protein FerR (iron transport regulator)